MDVFLGLVAGLLATFGALQFVVAHLGVGGNTPYAEIALGSVAALLAGFVLAAAVDLGSVNELGTSLLQGPFNYQSLTRVAD